MGAAKPASPARAATARTPSAKSSATPSAKPGTSRKPAPVAAANPASTKATPAVATKPAHKPVASTGARHPAPDAAVTPAVSLQPASAPAPAPAPAPATTRMTSSARSKANAKAQAAYAAPAPMPAPTSRFADRFAPPRPPTRQMNHLEVDRERQPQKHDPRLVNAWKSKAGRDLTEAELLAMPEAEYMNEKQLDYFRATLGRLKDDLLSNAGQTTENLREDTSIVPDPADRATIEEEHALELRTRDRERKLMKKISQSLARIESGDYGFCDETGEPIGLGRLLARPTATLSLEAQQRRELKQKMFGD
ncbi:MAG TPA: RNA polymerase-binding protein DksA [Burkholderiaceae bacterium]|nr:RNA polymerase-binding protein DksA [Burkholderiaceae bacterium]